MKKGLYRKAFKALVATRGSQIQAAKEMIYLDAQIQAAEAKLFSTPAKDEELFPNNAESLEDRIHDEASLASHDDRSSIHSGETDLVDDEDEDDDDALEEEIPTLWQRCIKQLKSMRKLLRPQHDDMEDPTTFQAQFKLTNYWQRIAQLMTVPRTRRACLAAFVVMISQQLCAINILAFYSSTLFRDSDESSEGADATTNPTASSLAPLWYSWGFGMANFLFAFPAYRLIDRKGRRYLLLVTFPLMALTLLAAAFSYNIPPGKAHIGVVYFWFILFTVSLPQFCSSS